MIPCAADTDGGGHPPNRLPVGEGQRNIAATLLLKRNRMSSLVEELQRDALDHRVRLSDLLRKAKTIAVKLDLPELENGSRTN